MIYIASNVLILIGTTNYYGDVVWSMPNAYDITFSWRRARGKCRYQTAYFKRPHYNYITMSTETWLGGFATLQHVVDQLLFTCQRSISPEWRPNIVLAMKNILSTYKSTLLCTLDVHIMAGKIMVIKNMVVKNMVTFLKSHQILTTKLIGLFFDLQILPKFPPFFT